MGTPHDQLEVLKQQAPDKAAQIQNLQTAFGDDVTLKITGNARGNSALGALADTSDPVPPATHVQALLATIAAQENGHPDTKRDAMEAALRTAVKADPTFIDRLEAQLAADPNLAGKITSRYMDNPAGLQAKLGDLIKSNNISAVMAGIPATPPPTTATPTTTPVRPGTATPTASPTATPTTGPFDEAAELRNIQPQATQDAVKATFDKIANNPTIKPEFDKLQDDQKRDLIRHLAAGAAADPAFLNNVNGLVDSSPQLISQGMDRFADHTQDAVRDDMAARNNPAGTTPGGPAADSNPLSGILGSLLGGGMMGRIMGVLSGLLNMIVGFFEHLVGGGGDRSGVSNNGFGLTRDAGAIPPGGNNQPGVIPPGGPRQPVPGQP